MSERVLLISLKKKKGHACARPKTEDRYCDSVKLTSIVVATSTGWSFSSVGW
jgi:hypothetical protein